MFSLFHFSLCFTSLSPFVSRTPLSLSLALFFFSSSSLTPHLPLCYFVCSFGCWPTENSSISLIIVTERGLEVSLKLTHLTAIYKDKAFNSKHFSYRLLSRQFPSIFSRIFSLALIENQWICSHRSTSPMGLQPNAGAMILSRISTRSLRSSRLISRRYWFPQKFFISIRICLATVKIRGKKERKK